MKYTVSVPKKNGGITTYYGVRLVEAERVLRLSSAGGSVRNERGRVVGESWREAGQRQKHWYIETEASSLRDEKLVTSG